MKSGPEATAARTREHLERASGLALASPAYHPAKGDAKKEPRAPRAGGHV
jgi:hypothetical protein